MATIEEAEGVAAMSADAPQNYRTTSAHSGWAASPGTPDLALDEMTRPPLHTPRIPRKRQVPTHRLVDLMPALIRKFARPSRTPLRNRPNPMLVTPPAQLEQLNRIHELDGDPGPEPMFVTSSVARALRASIGELPAETGGMLGGRASSSLVTHFHFDTTANRSPATYSPDATNINALLREQWNPAGVRMLGFNHSHPAGCDHPSCGDLAYAERILASNPALDRLLMPITQSRADSGHYRINGFAIRRADGRAKVERVPVVTTGTHANPEQFEEFARVHDAYDLPAMSRCRIVSIGTGGAAGFLEDMARCGVGEFILIDPDIVSSTNLATQQTYRRDLGRPKVQAIAERIVDVNPGAHVWVQQSSLDDLDDAFMRRACLDPMAPVFLDGPGATLLCAFTDSFSAQARVNRLALHLGVAHLAGAVYREGRGVEVAFAAPGVTRACVRCATRSRYVAHLEKNYQPDVTSHGTPIWATGRLNAAKAPIALALLHQASRRMDHPGTVRYRDLLLRVATRNLVLTSLDPAIDSALGLTLFSEIGALDPSGRLVMDQTAWLHQEPDHPNVGYPECPDCGGTGELSDSIGAFADTRPFPRTFGEHRRPVRAR